MAVAHSQPAPRLLVHCDRGSEYASPAHTDIQVQHCLIASMSRKGNCWDNAVMERFFLNLKMDRIWQRDDAHHEKPKSDIADDIVGFYNPVRLHSTLEYRSPIDHERRHFAERAA